MAIVEQNPFGISEALIREVTGRIVRAFDPQKIILFGSLAHGQPRQDSDLDLFVILNSSIDRPDVRAMHMRRPFRDLDIPMDLIAYTPEEVMQSLKNHNPFIRDILSEGRLLYERRGQSRPRAGPCDIRFHPRKTERGHDDIKKNYKLHE